MSDAEMDIPDPDGSIGSVDSWSEGIHAVSRVWRHALEGDWTCWPDRHIAKGASAIARLVALGIGLACAAENAHAQNRIGDLEMLVGLLSAETIASRTSFDRAFGTRLVDEGGGHFVSSRATDVALAGMSFREVELRTPRPGARVSAGPLLVLSLDREAGACISTQDLREAYPDLRWFGPGSPSNMDPDQTLERREGAARLFFSFPVYGPDCLRQVVYRFDEPF